MNSFYSFSQRLTEITRAPSSDAPKIGIIMPQLREETITDTIFSPVVILISLQASCFGNYAKIL